MDTGELKQAIRREGLARRRAQTDKDGLSRAICQRLAALDAFRSARAVAIYLDARSEVRTTAALDDWLASGKKIAVPYVAGGVLKLFHLADRHELIHGQYGILEPKVELRALAERAIRPDEPDLFLVPGVAFDPRGARLGHGLGYYDKLLAAARAGATRVGLAFECQIFPEIPLAPHDILMDAIVTEQRTHLAPDRSAGERSSGPS